MTGLINSQAAFDRAGETLNTRDKLHNQPLDPSVFHRTCLKDACVIDPPRPVTSNASRPRPVYNPRERDYDDPPKRPLPAPIPRPARSFIPFSHSEGPYFSIYCLETGQRLFKVRGSYRHALREAHRYLRHNGPGRFSIRPATAND